jgi:hypothetical protein
MRKGFKDAEFHREYKKLTGEEPDPLMPEEMEKAIREMPRDAEVIDSRQSSPIRQARRRSKPSKKTFRRGATARAITARAAHQP